MSETLLLSSGNRSSGEVGLEGDSGLIRYTHTHHLH